MDKKNNEIFLKTRVDEGLTQSEFAEKLDISRSLVARIESGLQTASLKTMKKLYEVFHNGNDVSKADEWKSETVLAKDHYIINIIDSYKKNIDSIEYFKSKITIGVQIITNLKGGTASNFAQLLNILDKNYSDLKEIYSMLIIGSLTKEEINTNKELYDNNSDLFKKIFSSEFSNQLEKQSNDLIQQADKLTDLYKNCFDDVFNLIFQYSELSKKD